MGTASRMTRSGAEMRPDELPGTPGGWHRSPWTGDTPTQGGGRSNGAVRAVTNCFRSGEKLVHVAVRVLQTSSDDAVELIEDRSLGMVRPEGQVRACGSHLAIWSRERATRSRRTKRWCTCSPSRSPSNPRRASDQLPSPLRLSGYPVPSRGPLPCSRGADPGPPVASGPADYRRGDLDRRQRGSNAVRSGQNAVLRATEDAALVPPPVLDAVLAFRDRGGWAGQRIGAGHSTSILPRLRFPLLAPCGWCFTSDGDFSRRCSPPWPRWCASRYAPTLWAARGLACCARATAVSGHTALTGSPSAW